MDRSEVEAYDTTRYRCPFCRRSYASRSYAQRHADNCTANPAERCCRTCAHRELPCCSDPDPRISQCGCRAMETCAIGLMSGGEWERDCPEWTAEVD